MLAEGQCLNKAMEDDYNQKSERKGTQGIFPVHEQERKRKKPWESFLEAEYKGL